MADSSACPHCNSKLMTVTYQSRSADEAPDVIQLCYNCHLDTQRLLEAAKYSRWQKAVLPLGMSSELVPHPATLAAAHGPQATAMVIELELRLDTALSTTVLTDRKLAPSTVSPRVIWVGGQK